MSPIEKLALRFRKLSKIDKAFLIALFLRIAYGLFGTAAGFDLPGYTLVRFLFIAATLIFLVRSFPRLVRKVLWRVRHRLLVTWIFVGVVPIVLFCMLVAEGLYFLMGQTVGYMTTNEIERHSELIGNTANALAWSVSHRGASSTVQSLTEAFVRETSEARRAQMGAIVKTGKDVVVVPRDGAISEIPQWSKPDSHGLIKNREDGDQLLFSAHVALETGADKTQVFLYEHAPAEFFNSVLPEIATVSPAIGRARAGGIDIQRTEGRRKSGVSFNKSRPEPEDPDLKANAPPPPRGWWDFPINWLVLMPSKKLADGETDQSILIVSSRSSLAMKKLFSSLGDIGPVILFAMIVTGAIFLVVEIVSALFGAKLTRSITRAVADIYEGTRKVQAGDFSHRIPLRKNKDQLSELAGSFNSMTGRIQDLIVEVKEKERLENELAIARDVQSQLFPKEVPHLKTLELWGGCQPARTVSGDYYDFVALDSGHAALAIGDISGKGISAALLMAHIQSALRSQFMYRNGQVNGSSSPSRILAILNDHLYTSSAPEKYATFFLGLYTEESGQLVYTNAGHLAPMLLRRGKVQRLAGEGFPVGLFPHVQYDQQSIGLEPGDLLVGFTDGVTETPNRAAEEWGDGRLTDLLIRLADKPLDQIASEITSSVTAWAGDMERHDDTTLVLARHL